MSTDAVNIGALCIGQSRYRITRQFYIPLMGMSRLCHIKFGRAFLFAKKFARDEKCRINACATRSDESMSRQADPLVTLAMYF